MMHQADMDPVAHVEDEVKSPKVGGGGGTTTTTTWGSSSSAVLAGSQRCKPRIGHTHQAEVSPYRLDLELSPVVDEEAEEEAEDMETLYSNGLAYLPLTHILHPLRPENDVEDSAADLKEMEGKQLRGTKKRKRRGSRWARMGKMPKKLTTDIGRKSFVYRAAASSSRGDNNNNNNNNNMQQENFGVGAFVPEEEPEVWSDSEISAFVLGLHLFGKELNSVKRLIGSKRMKDVMNYYYGPFYKSAAFLRWVSAKNSQSRRCVHGARIVSGWRQQELLLKLNSLLPDPIKQEQLLKAATAFNAAKISLLDFVLKLKAVAGVDLLVQCVGVGFQKLDLSVVQVEPCSLRVELPAGKALSTLSSEGIVNILVGDIRISKMRARDLFWEAVWPRLLAHNWRSEEIGSHSLLGPKNTLIFFHSCALDVSEADLEKGVHYFDSVSEVLDLVASNPSLLEYPGSDAIDSIQTQGNEDTNSQQECCTDTSVADGDNEIKKHVLEPLCSEPPLNGSNYGPCETSVDLNCQREERGQEALPLPDCRTSHLREACSAKECERDHQNGHDVVDTREYLGRHEGCCVDFLGGSSAVVAQSVEENVEPPGFSELGGICNLQLQYPSFDSYVAPNKGKEEADEMEIEEQVYFPSKSKDTQFVDICKVLEPTQARRPDEKLSSCFGIVTRILDTKWREQADNNHGLVDANSILDKLETYGDGCGKLLLSLRTAIEEPPQYCIENDIQRVTSTTLGSMDGHVKPAGVPKPSKLTGCVSTSRDLIVSETNYTFYESISSVDADNYPSNTNELDGVSVSCTFDRGFRNCTAFEFNRIARQPKWYQEPPMLQFSALGKRGLVSTMVLLQGNGKQPHYSPSWLPSGFHKVERPIRMWSDVWLNHPVEQDGEEPAEDYGVQGLCMFKRRRSLWSVVQQRRGEPKSGGALMSSFLCNKSIVDLHQVDNLVPIKRARSSSRPRRCIPKSLLFNTTLVRQDTSERGSGTDFLSELLLKTGAITTATPAPRDDEIEDDMLLASLIHKKPVRLLEMPPAAPQPHPIQYFPLDDELLHVDMEEKMVVTGFEAVEEDLDRSLEGTELVGECVEEGADSGSSLVTTENNFLERFSMTTCNVSGRHCQSGSERIHGEGMQQTSEDPVTSLPEKKWPIKPLATKVWEKQNRNGVVDTLALAFQNFQSFTKTYTRSPKLVGKRSTTVWSTRPSIPKLVLTISPRKRCTVLEATDNEEDDRFKVEKSDIKEEEVSSMESNTKGNSGVKRKRSERVRRRAGWRRLLFKQDSSDDAEEEEEEEPFFDSDFVASHFEWKYPFRSHQSKTPGLQSLSQCNHSPRPWKSQLSPTTRQCCFRSLCSASSCSGSCTWLRQHQLRVTAGSSKSSRSWKVEPSQHGMHTSGCTEETTSSARRPRHGIWFAPHRKSAKTAGKVKKPVKRPRTQQGSVC